MNIPSLLFSFLLFFFIYKRSSLINKADPLRIIITAIAARKSMATLDRILAPALPSKRVMGAAKLNTKPAKRILIKIDMEVMTDYNKTFFIRPGSTS